MAFLKRRFPDDDYDALRICTWIDLDALARYTFYMNVLGVLNVTIKSYSLRILICDFTFPSIVAVDGHDRL